MEDSKPISAFEKLKKRAESLLKDPDAAIDVINRAAKKAAREGKHLNTVKGDFSTLILLLKSYFKGEYRMVPWTTIISALAATLYFLNPFDVVPDMILGFGFVDDATVIAFCLRSIKKDLDQFSKFKGTQSSSTPSPQLDPE